MFTVLSVCGCILHVWLMILSHNTVVLYTSDFQNNIKVMLPVFCVEQNVPSSPPITAFKSSFFVVCCLRQQITNLLTLPFHGNLHAPFLHLTVCIKVREVEQGFIFNGPLICLWRQYQNLIRDEFVVCCKQLQFVKELCLFVLEGRLYRIIIFCQDLF